MQLPGSLPEPVHRAPPVVESSADLPAMPMGVDGASTGGEAQQTSLMPTLPGEVAESPQNLPVAAGDRKKKEVKGDESKDQGAPSSAGSDGATPSTAPPQENMETDPCGVDNEDDEQEEVVPQDPMGIERLLTWMAEQTEMVHDLLTCVRAIMATSTSDSGEGELFLACFRAMQTADQIHREKAWQHLTEDQIGALVMYTYEFMGTDIYSKMNRIIGQICRKEAGEKDEHNAWKPFIRLFLSACKKAASKFEVSELYRGQPLRCEKAYQVGAQWSPWRCMSTSLSKEAALKFPADGKAELLTIKLAPESFVYGVPMTPFSNFMEAEILLFPNQLFNVTVIQKFEMPPSQRHKREVHLHPAGDDVLAALPVSSDGAFEHVDISVAAHIKARHCDLTTAKITFREPNGLKRRNGADSDHSEVVVRYSGESTAGLLDDQLYVVRVQEDDPNVAQLFVASNGRPAREIPAMLPALLPSNAVFVRTVAMTVKVSEHRRMWMKAGMGMVAFKFGGKDLFCGLQWGGVRVIDTMRLPNFCLWYSQADIVFALILVILLATSDHSGATYFFPFVDILVQMAFCWRLHRKNRISGIRDAKSILIVRCPFYFVRFVCGVFTLIVFLADDSVGDSTLAFCMIVAMKVFSPFSMAVTLAYSIYSGAVESVQDQADAAVSLDHFVNAARSHILEYKCSGSLFIYYESCLHGYLAQILHIIGAFLVFIGFCWGLAVDIMIWLQICCAICSSKDDDNLVDSDPVIIASPCPPRCILYPASAMSLLVKAVGHMAHTMVSKRIEEWEEAGGEQVCLVALGLWQRKRFEASAEREYWKRERAQLAEERRQAKDALRAEQRKAKEAWKAEAQRQQAHVDCEAPPAASESGVRTIGKSAME